MFPRGRNDSNLSYFHVENLRNVIIVFRFYVALANNRLIIIDSMCILMKIL